MRSWMGLLTALLSIWGGAASAQVSVPQDLDAWRGWALHESASLRCPVRDGERASSQCRWPGTLGLDVDADGLQFVQSWTTYAAAQVPLPGDRRWRPLEVEVDGRAAAVVLDPTGKPWLSLPAGTHRVRGRIDWERRPASLPVPAEVALIELRLDGSPLARPQRDEDGDLVLGAVAVEEGDGLQIESFRLLADGVPQWLVTRLDVSVSGKPREALLDDLLPSGFVPVAIDSEIAARLEQDGGLRLQLRSGQWRVTVFARAGTVLDALRLDTGPDWPAEEIWQFRADPRFRVAQLTGLPGVDPAQLGLPDWSEALDSDLPNSLANAVAEADGLPTYLFRRDAEARIEVSLRGLPVERPSRLSLQRSLWLDFDGEAYSSVDRIRGELGGASRIDLGAPWSMQRASREGQGLLITEGIAADTQGVELRDADVNVEVDARVPRQGVDPASGWTHSFDSARIILNLPPAYRLIAATGADRASGSWWDRWDLLDLFLLSLAVLMAWRLGGLPMGGLALAYGLLAWHAPDAPRASLLVLLALSLLARQLTTGRVAGAARALRLGALAVVGLLALGFAAGELRLALYPQLERAGFADGGRDYDDVHPVELTFADATPASIPAPAPPPEAEQSTYNAMRKQSAGNLGRSNGAELDRIQVTGSRIKSVDLFSYPADAMVQSGAARADWRWHRHELVWNGPLLSDDRLGLIISPPWMTRLWRVLAVGVLGLLLWRLARRAPRVAQPAAAAGLAGLLLLPMLASTPASAQSFPDLALLDTLRERLLTRTEPCRPHCAALGEVALSAGPEHLRLRLEAQVQAEVVWPLPRPDQSLLLATARVGGLPAQVLRDAQGDWLRLEAGVHRIDLEYVPDGARWRLAFPLPPAKLDVQAPGFEIVGLEQRRLVGDTLELIPLRTGAVEAGEASEPQGSAEAVPAFVQVTRHFILDQQWEQVVTVQRVAPRRGGINLRIPLLPGEQPFADPPPLRDGEAVVSLPAGVDRVQWRSRLSPQPALTLVAGDGSAYVEDWSLAISPLLHVDTHGLPESALDDPDGGLRRFLPLPGETLTAEVSRPAAVDGYRFAIENVRLQVTPGARARDSALDFALRASQPGQHHVRLPDGAELLSYSIDGESRPPVLEEGAVRLPLRPSTQQVSLRWREPITLGSVVASPPLSLDASTSGIRVSVNLPAERWILLTRGPQVGPAVLFWGELLVMVLAALALSRIGGTPLRFHHWLLLGLGFSTLSWGAALLVAAWLLLLGWRGRHPELVERRVFPWLQILLVGISALALLALVIAVPYGLLGRPDMHIVGNGSSAQALHWFADRSEAGALPMVQVISLPMWSYKLAILAWSLWLANALLGWLRWGWQGLNRGGGWRPIFRRGKQAPVANADTAPVPAPDTDKP